MREGEEWTGGLELGLYFNCHMFVTPASHNTCMRYGQGSSVYWAWVLSLLERFQGSIEYLL